ncbi:cytochrome b/b6 domain-containing protein [Desulfocurvus sp. DL9XJH121]
MKHTITRVLTSALVALLLVPSLAFGIAGSGAEQAAAAHGVPLARPGLENTRCASCHGDAEITPRTPKGAGLALHKDGHAYSRSVHAGLACVDCHKPRADAADFDKVPHTLAQEQPDCLSCHGKFFQEQERAYKASYHYEKLKDALSCADCHDPHAMRRTDVTMPAPRDVAAGNKLCMDCHTSLTRFKELAKREVWEQDISHAFLPEKERHFQAVRCVECHTSGQGREMHVLLSKDKARKDCASCHGEDSLVVARLHTPLNQASLAGSFLGKGLFDDADLVKALGQAKKPETPPVRAVAARDPRYANGGLFTDSFFVGASRSLALDSWIGGLFLATILAVLLHGALRLAMSGRRITLGGEPAPEYGRGARLMHWSMALAVVVLLATGFSLRFGQAAWALPFAWSHTAHKVAGILLCALLLAKIAGGGIRDYLPRGGNAGGRMAAQAAYYLWGIFRSDRHPSAAPGQRLNPLQQAAYLVALCVALPLQIATGALMFFPDLVPAASSGGEPLRLTVASLHAILALGFGVFLVGHVYLGTTGRTPLSLFKAMLKGRDSGPDEKR